MQTNGDDIANGMLTYPLGSKVLAFTTDRTIGREPERVKAAVLERLGRDGGREVESAVQPLRYVRPHQVHGDKTMLIAEDFFTLSEQAKQMLMEGVDAVISNVTSAILGVSTADCIPVLVYDPEHNAAAAIHAGWRGTVKRIVEKTIDAMRRLYGTNPSVCRAAIGPGISLESFEVGDEVYAAFAEAGFDMTGAADRFPAIWGEEGGVPQAEKWHIDLKEINRRQLTRSGIEAENICVSSIDTFTDSRFFSARREQKGDVKCGRIFSGFVIPG